jgi:hypothetical protein
MKLTVKKPFSWAHKGVTVVAYEAGQTIETDDQDLIDVSTKEGWTSKARGPAKPAVDAGAGDAKPDTSDTETSAGDTDPSTGDTGADAADTGATNTDTSTDTNTGI